MLMILAAIVGHGQTCSFSGNWFGSSVQLDLENAPGESKDVAESFKIWLELLELWYKLASASS